MSSSAPVSLVEAGDRAPKADVGRPPLFSVAASEDLFYYPTETAKRALMNN